MVGFIQLLGRIMLALIFVLAGIGKIIDPAGTSSYMESMNVDGMLLWPVIALEVLGGIALIVGYKTSIVAFALAIFCIAAAVIFHSNFGDKMQMVLFLKNFSMAGGLLILSVSGKTAYSIDNKKKYANFFSTRL
ncbi:MAG TPA: DoxX family protein [Methylophilaceae bacterium]|nr:DoxX family protein [Methylophilaceae bacterium]